MTRLGFGDAQDFNPRSPCGERPFLPEVPQGHREISIRAPLAGSDSRRLRPRPSRLDFNPRSPCGERRKGGVIPALPVYFNPRSPCGERRCAWRSISCSTGFQSALPLRGATRCSRPSASPTSNFNPRSPCGERLTLLPRRLSQRHFNPRSPCGERRSVAISESGRVEFQSALPLRGATVDGDSCGAHRNFNPRSPCGERRTPATSNGNQGDFNPRSPCGERHCSVALRPADATFQSALPLRGATGFYSQHPTDSRFQSALPLRGATSITPWPLTR